MKASILTIGDEILIGQVVDTNSAWLGQELSQVGITVKKIYSVGDRHQEIIDGLNLAAIDVDIIFITGGLGPTKDDITKKAIADYLGVDMYFDQGTFERIKGIFERMGREMSPLNHDQCLMPTSVKLLKNSMGTAPGMLFVHDGIKMISMPGVPYEMKAIMTEEVLPMLLSSIDTTIIHKTILTSCTGETMIENKIAEIVSSFPPNLKVAYLPSLAQVRVRLSIKGNDKAALQAIIDQYTDKIVSELGDIVFGFDKSALEKEIKNICIEKKLTVGTAESCTGGLVANKLVSIPGSSAYFKGGIVAYNNEVKEQLLKVSKETISQYGAVSEETVMAMVDGCLDTLSTDIAVAISGIAGPDGGSENKPVGTIWICVGSKKEKKTYLLKSGKDRLKNIEIAAIYALSLLRKFVLPIN